MVASYTQLGRDEINILLKSYNLGELKEAKPLPGGQANSSYKLTTSSGSFTLSVCDEKSPDEVAILTHVLEHLQTHNFPSTRLVRCHDGSAYSRYKDKPVYIKQFLNGDVVQELDSKMLFQVGNLLAKLHSLPAPESVPSGSPYSKKQFEEVLSAGLNHPFKTWLAEKIAQIDHEINPNAQKGFIHGDLFWDNILFEESKITAILDFEETRNYYLLYDIGMTAIGCCSTNGHFNNEKVNLLLDGYQQQYPFSTEEKDQVVPFIIYAATAAAFWRFRQYNLRHPSPDFANSYKELASLADNPPELQWNTL